MTSKLLRRTASVALLVAACLRPLAAEDPEIVAVLSSELPPYLEAVEGFQEAFSAPVPVLHPKNLSSEGLPRARVIVAFGGKAASLEYPEGTLVIACMAPTLPQGGRETREVLMTPGMGAVLKNLRALQPGLRRIGVLWASPGMSRYHAEMSKESEGSGLEVSSGKVTGPNDIPVVLRALAGRVDALWLTPDPALVTPGTFETLRDFSRDNGIAFYVPTPGLVEQGATAAVASSFRDIGRTAASAARDLLAGRPVPRKLSPADARVIVGRRASKRLGLKLPPEAIVVEEQTPGGGAP